MQFVEYNIEDAKKIVLSWFAAEPSITNEKMLERSIVIENEKELKDFNLYSSGLMKIDKVSFKFNISAYVVMDMLVCDGCVTRENGVQTITDKGKEEISYYFLNDHQFDDMVKVAKLRVITMPVNWKRFSADLIDILKLNEEKYKKD